MAICAHFRLSVLSFLCGQTYFVLAVFLIFSSCSFFSFFIFAPPAISGPYSDEVSMHATDRARVGADTFFNACMLGNGVNGLGYGIVPDGKSCVNPAQFYFNNIK